MIKKILLIFIFVGINQTFSLAFDYSRYKQSSINEVKSSILKEIKESFAANGHQVPSNVFAPLPLEPYKLDLVYKEEIRSLNSETNFFLEKFYKTFPSLQHVKKHFSKELRVEENGKVYWLLVQDVLIPYLKNEIKNGEKFEVYAVCLGYEEGKIYFLINEFKSLTSQ